MKFDFKTRQFIDQSSEGDKPALISRQRITRWIELQQQVEQTRQRIASQACDGPVVIYGHKQHEFVITMLACIQLSVPYVPVDTIYPRERLQAIQQQLGSGLLIDLEQQQWSAFDYGQTRVQNLQQQLMYILFTSGSTGAPKGVQITYDAFLDFWGWVESDFPMNSDSVILSQSLFTFDVSMMDVASAMGHGGSLLLIDRDIYQDHQTFFGLLQQHGCTDWVSTPSFVSRWLMAKNFNSDNFPALKRFTLAGEALPHRIASQLNKRFGDGCVYNAYGPTEATVVVTLLQVNQQLLDQNPSNLPIGYTKTSGEVVVLNEKGEVTDGEGEIVICGDNVSIGYLDPGLPANRAFFQRNGMRAYRTGDYGYFKGDLLYYLGRRDDQIKLNGYRIETTEIEKVLDQADGVETSVVLGLKRGDKVVRLIAFSFQESADFSPERSQLLQQQLRQRLPEYMVPSEILLGLASRIPLNKNHKIDRNKLLELYQQDEVLQLQQPAMELA
ncbi:AMP-binding protein [Endozoicomonadaceae bacterium StTr2]